MPPEQRLADYLAGTLTAHERAELEAALATDPEGLRELAGQRRLDAALSALLEPNPERVEAAIMATLRGVGDAEAATRVLEQTAFAPSARDRRGGWKAALHWLSPGTHRHRGAVAVAVILVALWTGLLREGPGTSPG